MVLRPISQCGDLLNFSPLKVWPSPLPPVCWRGQLLVGFGRTQGDAIDLSEKNWLELWQALHPELQLCELSRLLVKLKDFWPDLFLECHQSLAQANGLRWSDRLAQLSEKLVQTPLLFQNFCDQKKMSVRDLEPLLSIEHPREMEGFFIALPSLLISKSEAARALELFIELFLLGRPLSDLLPTSDNGSLYVRRLEKWLKPNALQGDEQKSEFVRSWPWPKQVKGEWLRQGDQSGVEVKFYSTSPEDMQKKLERLLCIPKTWSSDPS